MRSLISVFVNRCLDSRISILAISKLLRLLAASVAEQAGLSLTFSQNPQGFLVAWLIKVTVTFSFCYRFEENEKHQKDTTEKEIVAVCL